MYSPLSLPDRYWRSKCRGRSEFGDEDGMDGRRETRLQKECGISNSQYVFSTEEMCKRRRINYYSIQSGNMCEIAAVVVTQYATEIQAVLGVLHKY